MENMLLNIGLGISGLGVGFGIGYKIGYSVALPKVVTTVKRQCDTWFQNNPRSWASIELHMRDNKIVTNACSALIGEKCKYTNKKCQLL